MKNENVDRGDVAEQTRRNLQMEKIRIKLEQRRSKKTKETERSDTSGKIDQQAEDKGNVGE